MFVYFSMIRERVLKNKSVYASLGEGAGCPLITSTSSEIDEQRRVAEYGLVPILPVRKSKLNEGNLPLFRRVKARLIHSITSSMDLGSTKRDGSLGLDDSDGESCELTVV